MRSNSRTVHKFKAVPTPGAYMFVPACGVRAPFFRSFLKQRYDRPIPKERLCKRCKRVKA